MTVDVVVLAGGQNSAAMEAASGVKNRALTPIGTRTMLDYITSSLSLTPSVRNVYVVGPVPESEEYKQVTGGETLLDNLLAGLNAAGPQKRILISTSDIPFVTPAAIGDFIQRASASGADFCCSYVPLQLCRERFPEMKRTAIKTAEGQWTLGNIMLVNPEMLAAQHTAISEAYAARKSPVKVAGLLGYDLLSRLVGAQIISPKMLTIVRVETSVSRLLGGRAVGICSAYPEIGTDIDKPEDVVIARRLLTVD